MAARTVYEAIDAATASDPAGQVAPAAEAPRRHPVVQTSASDQRSTSPRNTVEQAVRMARRVQGSVRAGRQSVLAPVKRASRAVSLEIAGSFFALFALSFGAAAWRFRAVAADGNEHRLWIYLGFSVLFGYFALSSFLRARRVTRA